MYGSLIVRFISIVFQLYHGGQCTYPCFPEVLLTRPCAYKTFFMLNSAEHEISKLDKSSLINLLEKLLTCKDFHCFRPLNQNFKFNLPYILKDKLSL